MAAAAVSPSPSPSLAYDIANLTVYDYFGYNPSTALASTAIALYGAATILVALLIFVYRHARYVHLVTVTGLMEAGGYIGLLWMILNTGETNLFSAYVAMQVLIILAPNLLQATDYWTISRVVVLGNLSNESFIFRPNILRATFILADLGALMYVCTFLALVSECNMNYCTAITSTRLFHHILFFMQCPGCWYINLGHIPGQWSSKPGKNYHRLDHHFGWSNPPVVLFLLFLCTNSYRTAS